MKRAIPWILLYLCAVTPAFAAELELSAGGEVEYDSNIFRTQDDEEDDVLFRLRPGIRIYEDHGDDLNYSLGYELPVEFAVNHGDEINDVDHYVNGIATYHVNDRFQLFGNERFGYLRSTFFRSQAFTDVASGSNVPNVNSQRERVKLNDAEVGGIYNFSQRTTGRLALSSNYFDSTREDRSRVYSIGGTADGFYRLTMNHQVGGGFGYTRQDFDDRPDFSGSATNIYNVFASWRWMIDPTMDLEIAAGPSYLESKQSNSNSARFAPKVPFIALQGQTLEGQFIDSSGATVSNPTVGPGSLLVPRIQDCGSVQGDSGAFFAVANGCRFPVFLDANNPTDQQTIASILTPIQLQNLDPAGDTSSNVTIFANVTLSKRWTENLATAFRYSREQGNASGLGGTVITDAVSLSNTWNFWDRWQLAVRGDWTRRESVFDQSRTFNAVFGVNQADLGAPPAGTLGVQLAGLCDPRNTPACTSGLSFNSSQAADINTDRWGVAGRITHQLFRTTSIYAQVRYDQQSSKNQSLGDTTDFDDFLATFGVQHVFEPIKLW